jgi:hypothetical protein
MLFSAFDVDKRTSAQLVALASDGRFASGPGTVPAAGNAVGGDYTESPANRRCFLILAGVTYCLLPVLPELGAGVVVLLPLPEPMPLELGEVGLVVLPLELEPEPVVLLPDAPLPALPLRASRSHVSLSAPVMARHLLASLPDAPDAAPAEPDVPEVELPLLPEDELPEADGVVVLLPEEPAPALPAPEAPELPEPEPEDCENATPDSARSAAAVAAVRVFNIMESLLRRVDESCAVLHASSMPCPRKKFSAGAECARW